LLMGGGGGGGGLLFEFSTKMEQTLHKTALWSAKNFSIKKKHFSVFSPVLKSSKVAFLFVLKMSDEMNWGLNVYSNKDIGMGPWC